MDAINTFYTTTCAGQHLDLIYTPDGPITEDSYLYIAERKSASTISCACHVGALVANANKKMVDQFTEFGYNLGMASQIANDITGITQKDDILKAKITLPVIYTLSQRKSKIHSYIEDIFIKRSNLDFDIQKVKDIFFNSGAIYYSTVKMEYFKQRAIDILLKIEKAKVNIRHLKVFVK